MNACSAFRASDILKGRCANCGSSELAHRGLVNPRHVLARMNETFDRMPTHYESHAEAIADVYEFFGAPLTVDISNAADDALNEHPELLAPSEICDLLSHQVEQLRDLGGAGEDLDQPDLQARHRLVKLAGMATAFAELLDRRLAKHAPATKAVATSVKKTTKRRGTR